ncbi:MAG: hypothetical protein M0P12_00315 [Paludibacteraceae bacterium]|nr:hypothetical protein [Paludibacteraceae bacterium]MCK9615965.1 hypothetical protein [Candidatus Omnitrophota bacterium]
MAKRKNIKEEQAQTRIKKVIGQDLFKLMTEMLGRELTDEETEIIIESAKIFVADTFLPNFVYDKEVLKETALSNEIVTKDDFEDFEDFNEEDGFEDKQYSRYDDLNQENGYEY